jgi:hypothetical protein
MVTGMVFQPSLLCGRGAPARNVLALPRGLPIRAGRFIFCFVIDVTLPSQQKIGPVPVCVGIGLLVSRAVCLQFGA